MITRKKVFLCFIFLFGIDSILLSNILEYTPDREYWTSIPQALEIPKSKVKEYKNDHFYAFLYCKNFSQGELLQGKIILREKIKIKKILFDKKYVPFQKIKKQIYYFIPLSIKQKLGNNYITIEYKFKRKLLQKRLDLNVSAVRWKNSKVILNLGKFSQTKKTSKKFKKKLKKFRKDKKKAFTKISKLFLNNLRSHPLSTHFVTSSFGAKRLVKKYKLRNGVKKQISSNTKIHLGLDLRGNRNNAIYALANGQIILSKKMYYEGIYTVINHGHGIFTGYMHQSASFMKVRRKVIKAGKKIGMVGKTGAVTGPHLHLLLYVRGVYLDPMSFLSLPLIDR